MKKFLLYIIPAILLFSACGKEKSFEVLLNSGGGGSNPQYFIKCKIDGVDKTFNTAAMAAKFDLGGGITSYSVFGKVNLDVSNLESLNIGINTNVPLTTTTYKVDDPSLDYTMGVLYNPNTQEPDELFSSSSGDGPTDPFQVTITSLTSTEIAGTFQGLVYLQDITNPTPPTKTITAGEFKVKFQ